MTSLGKRKANEYSSMDDESLDMAIENMAITDSCDAVRRKIRNFLDSGEMKIGEFQRALMASPNAYSRFMGQNGPDKGAGCSVYYAAWAFFKKREMRGIKMPKKQKTATAAVGKGDSVLSVEGIVLDGEAEENVPCFDTCDDVRRKMNAHLKLPGVTQASFLRNVSAQFPDKRRIQSSQLGAFRSKKGPYAGNTSSVYYGAYVYLEKLRIKENKPKGKKREEMERLYAAKGGIDRQRQHQYYYLTRPWESVSHDAYGRLHVV